MRKKIKIAILGATSYVAKGIICELYKKNDYELFLFARDRKSLQTFCVENKLKKDIYSHYLQYFETPKEYFDVIINCILPRFEFTNNFYEIFSVGELYDNLILEYLKHNPETLYIYLSSGAVYGQEFNKKVDSQSKTILPITHISKQDFYCINKIYTEAKHRSLPDFNIVDLRLFGYFSKFIPLSDHYFLSQLLNCIKYNNILLTSKEDFLRDFVNSQMLTHLIECCIKKRKLNTFYDVYSEAPITKSWLLNWFAVDYGLKFEYSIDKIVTSTGTKNIYYSENRKASEIGYKPQYSSFYAIKKELNKMEI
jgi:nucleoside-diphosphate-sugar epimerase